MKCKYKPIERVGLYIMIIILLLFGPCNMVENHQEIIDAIIRIEKKAENKHLGQHI